MCLLLYVSLKLVTFSIFFFFHQFLYVAESTEKLIDAFALKGIISKRIWKLYTRIWTRHRLMWSKNLLVPLVSFITGIIQDVIHRWSVGSKLFTNIYRAKTGCNEDNGWPGQSYSISKSFYSNNPTRSLGNYHKSKIGKNKREARKLKIRGRSFKGIRSL